MSNKALSAKAPDTFAYRERALAYSHLNRLPDALTDINRSIEERPFYYSYVIKSNILESMHRYREAAVTYREALTKASGYKEFVINKIVSCLRKAGDRKEAIDFVSEQIKLKPQAQLFEWRAQIEQEIKSYDAAVADYGKAISLLPTTKYFRERATVYELMHRPLDAERDLQQAKKQDAAPLGSLGF